MRLALLMPHLPRSAFHFAFHVTDLDQALSGRECRRALERGDAELGDLLDRPHIT